MKKPFLMSLVSLSLIACSNEEFISPADNGDEMVSTIELRTETEAIAIATDALNEFYPATSRSVRDMSRIKVVTLGNVASRNEEITNPLYVVNFGDDNGYAIISANKDVEPLLAVTESGSITSLDEINNPGLGLFVAGAMKFEKDTTAIVPGPGTGGGELVDIWRNDTVFRSNISIPPRITVCWGQRYPEGSYCPNNRCGCDATAAAQALSYFEYPETLNLTFPERTSDQITLEWGNMRTIQSTQYWRPYGFYDNQLAALCREIGHKINADYGSDGTSASLSDLRLYLKGLLPADRFVISNLKNYAPTTPAISNQGIMLIRAETYDEDTNKYVGHAWVIDGVIHKDYTVYVYYHKADSPIEYLERQFDKKEFFFHANWGWNGKDNGFFRFDKFETTSHNFEKNFNYFTIETK